MGCDIHMVVERKEAGIWKPAILEHKVMYDAGARNYALFAVLAGVRDRWNVKPISEPRGIPKDISREHKHDDPEFEEEYGKPDVDEYLGDHSYSWLLLSELQAYPWKSPLLNSGVVGEAEFEEWDGTKKRPEYYSGGVSGPNIKNISNDEMREIVKTKKYFTRACKHFTEIEWEETLYEMCEEFVRDFIPALEKLGSPDEVRIVFGFDS